MSPDPERRADARASVGRRRRFDLDHGVEALCAGDRAALGRAITLVESRREADRIDADALVHRLLPYAGQALRVGITGMPGVGKSTLIEALGQRLVAAGQRVAVLAVDPSSARSGGSILGDKTRMTQLARDPRAFIRPSPSGGALGGVARRTRETIVLVEAAGYDVVLVETVGVGQSEVMVANMVDFFLVLTLAGGGDELQGIKRGILELCDLLVVTKADGDNMQAARRARAEYEGALALMPPRSPGWKPRVGICSAVTGEGLDALWQAVQEHRAVLRGSGEWERRRGEQRVHWLWQSIRDGLQEALERDDGVRRRLAELEQAVRNGATSPDVAAAQVLAAFLSRG
ncbi:methylmalonyl Co-A mutase-associated GTPase MeaB [Paraliomyxa miuraensis]|uniref:methylmalonyl Co-A mutase-associated GTPase MeaB n=1 Tax=Paraliomyxa miuraensis TaxID=376150 RepID=UPI002B1CB1A4|nr:methylmalonyl Co-A mutase-associated GTPase MeaB [Paraliomyxa miuraensis]